MGQTTKYIKLIGTFIRPDNTTEYTTGNTIGTSPASLIEFIPESGAITSGQSIKIESIKIVSSSRYVFDCNLTLLDNEQTAIEDGVTQELTFTNKANLLAVIPLGLIQADQCSYAITNTNVFIKTEVNNLYGYLTLASNTYTPDAEQEFYIELTAALIDG